MSEKAISKYRSIRDVLLSEIKSGVYDGTGTLPGEHELVSRFGAARETLRRAILELEHLGLVRRKHGVGTFVCKRGGCRSGVIGLLIPSASVARIFKDFERQISRFARLGGYRLVVQEAEVGTLAETKVRLRRVAREMALKNLDGVIMRQMVDDRFAEVNKEIVRIFKNAQVPVVLIDSDIVSPPARSDCDLVSVDNVSAGRRVAEHLYRKGCRKVAFMTSGSQLRNNANWRNRLFGVAGELALLKVKQAVRTLDFKPHDLAKLRTLWKSKECPDALVCGNDETAVALIESLMKIGKQVPRDVAVVGFDDAAFAASCPVPLTTVHLPVELIAKTAVKTLDTRIANPKGDLHEICLEAPLVVRQSC